MTPRFPARLHVLLASEAKVGVVWRRGPSKQVCSILWDRAKDTFELGQWLKGRIYERRADLSPDGRHLIYFAMNGKWDGKTGGSWTAVSRAPYLKALALYGKGDGWHGGGLFTGERSYWLNDGYGHRELEDSQRLRRDGTWHPLLYFGGECPGVYYPRLQRDGWRYLGNRVLGQYTHCSFFEKPLPRGWVLRKIAHEQVSHPPGKGCYWDEHVLEHPESKQTLARPDWEWADLDGSKLTWAEKGCLYRGTITRNGIGESSLLKDFNEMTFRRIIAPY
jgi:hypothetical protein